jgi:hypothetical protein
MHAPTLKRTPLNQFAGIALVLGLAASIAIGIAVHNRTSDDTTSLEAPSTTSHSSMGAKEARLDRDEAERALADHNTVLSASRNRWVDAKERRMDGTTDQRAMPTAMQRYYDAKVTRQEALELDASARAAHATEQQKLQRFYESIVAKP